MIVVGLYVANRGESIQSCIKKVFDDHIKTHFIPKLKKVKDIKQHISALADSKKDICFVCVEPDDIQDSLLTGMFFDVIVYDNMAGEDMPTKALSKRIHPKTIVISNGDDGYIPEFLIGMKICAITYGLGQKCSVTPSCIDTGENLHFNCCVQRSLSSVSGNEIEVGERVITINGSNINVYDALAATILRMTCE